jgi:hypothetical protein
MPVSIASQHAFSLDANLILNQAKTAWVFLGNNTKT